MTSNTLNFFERALHPKAQSLLAAASSLPAGQSAATHIESLLSTEKGPALYTAAAASYLLGHKNVSADVKGRLYIIQAVAEGVAAAEQKSGNIKSCVDKVLSYRTMSAEKETFILANGAAQYLASDRVKYASAAEKASVHETLAEHYGSYAKQFSDGPAYYNNKAAEVDAYAAAAKAYEIAGYDTKVGEMLGKELAAAQASGLSLKPDEEARIRTKLKMSPMV